MSLARYRSTAVPLALDFQRNIDELVFLPTDELALAGPVQQFVSRHAVTLALSDRMLEEAGVDPGVTHDQGVAVQQAFGGHRRTHDILSSIGNIEEVDAR